MKNINRKALLIILAILSSSILYSQATKQANFWFFGENAGIDFNGGATAITTGALSTSEGCSAISDSLGNLLFYSDGGKVWNANHDTMPNGTGLLGCYSATQSCLILPKPGNDNIYYVITLDCFENSLGAGLRYSEVDMTLNGGLGDVTATKNILLHNMVSEKLTATYKVGSNCDDIWLITHDWGSNDFLSYSITNTGINSTPVVSKAGTGHFGNYNVSVGAMKISPNGRKLATALTNSGKTELYDYDPVNGIVSNFVSLHSAPFSAPFISFGHYGLEFSPDGTKLYESPWGGSTTKEHLYQYDLSLGSSAAIIASRTAISSRFFDFRGALQLAPDGKIYQSHAYTNSLSVINNPNAAGVAAGFVENSFNLSGKDGMFGLPNIFPAFFNSPLKANFIIDNFCVGETIDFVNISSGRYDSLYWDFGDPASGAANNSNLTTPSHLYTSLGNYTVTLTAFNSCDNTIDSIKKTVIDTNADISVILPSTCVGDSIQLDAYSMFDSTFFVTPPISACEYTLRYFDNSGWAAGSNSSISVYINGILDFSYAPPWFVFSWDFYIAVKSGDSISLTFNSGTADDEIRYEFYDSDMNLIFSDGVSPLVGPSFSTIASCSPPATPSFSWTPTAALTSSTVANPFAFPATTTDYTVTVTEPVNGCTDSSKVTVTIIPPSVAIIDSVNFCVAQLPDTLTANILGGTWSGNGITDSLAGIFDPATAGLGTHQIIYSFGASCVTPDTIDIVVGNFATVIINPAGPFCKNGNSVTLSANIAGGVWSGSGITDTTLGIFNPTMTGGPGTFYVKYVISGVCSGNDSIPIIIDDTVTAAIINPVGPLCDNDILIPDNLISSGDTGVWSGTGVTDGLLKLGTFDPSVAGTGTHTVTYTVNSVNAVCTDFDTINIVVNNLSLTSSATQTCANPCTGSVEVFPVGTGSFNTIWSDLNAGLIGFSNPTNLLCASTYWVTVTDIGTGCIKNDTVTVSNFPIISDANFTYSPEPVTIANTLITLRDSSTGNPISWTWTIFDTDSVTIVTTGSGTSFTYRFPGIEGIYPVQLVINDGCSDIPIIKYIIIDDVYSLYVPTAFTPNGDGKNDIFFPQGGGIDTTNFSLFIYDRWGELIFEGTDISTNPNIAAVKGWDGTTSKRNGAPSGVYVWKVISKPKVLSDGSTEEIITMGRVTLLR